MTKFEMATKLADEMNLKDFRRAEALRAIDKLAEIIIDAADRDEAIFLRGFATIKPQTLKKRYGRNIQKGELVALPERKTIKLKVSRSVLKRLNP